jgi:hypothetical protein
MSDKGIMLNMIRVAYCLVGMALRTSLYAYKLIGVQRCPGCPDFVSDVWRSVKMFHTIKKVILPFLLQQILQDTSAHLRYCSGMSFVRSQFRSDDK